MDKNKQLLSCMFKLCVAVYRILVKVILAVVKQLKQLQRKPRKNSEASTGFEPMTSTILVPCSTD